MIQKTIDEKYDEKNATELGRILKREPTPAEIANSDNDTNLVTEVMWQLMKDMSDEIELLKNKSGII